MDRATFRELLSAEGQAALADAEGLAPTEEAFLSNFEKLRKRHAPALAKAAIETILLRRKARDKFAQADRMYFTREALEQATGEAAARHRARRFVPFGVVADLGCGIGGDALALAAMGAIVHAVESDPLRFVMAKANAEALEVADRITFHEGDALTEPLPDVRAAFADPSRRSGGRRHLDPESYTPPLSALRARFAPDFPFGVKIAPGVALSDVDHLNAEAEFVSVEGELKECVLWFGPLRTAARRATVLPAEQTLFAEEPQSLPPLAPVQEYILDPDPAIVRAGLAGQLGREMDVSPIDNTVAVFTAARPIASPFVTAYRVDLADRFNVSRLRDHLKSGNVGRATIVKRGSMIDADELQRKLKLAGSEHRVVLLTRAAGEPVMIVCERLMAASA